MRRAMELLVVSIPAADLMMETGPSQKDWDLQEAALGLSAEKLLAFSPRIAQKFTSLSAFSRAAILFSKILTELQETQLA